MVHSFTNMKFQYNDGGRMQAFTDSRGDDRRGDDRFLGNAGDCVTRALAIMTGRPYAELWDMVAALNVKEGKRKSANNGVRCSGSLFRSFMAQLGYTFVETTEEVPFNENGLRGVLRQNKKLKDVTIPMGRVMVLITRHAVAFVDGVMNDTHVSTVGNNTCYGYYIPTPDAKTATLFNVISATTRKVLNMAPLNAEAASTMQRLMWLNYRKQTLIEPYE